MNDTVKTYVIRHEGTFKDLRTLYGNDNTRFFTLERHHGGHFTRPPGRKYIDGKIMTIDFVDLEAFNIDYIDKLVEDVHGTYMNRLSTCKRSETMDYGIIRLLYNKHAKKFKETVIKEGLHIPYQVYAEYPLDHVNFMVFYPDTYKTAPPEKIAEILRDYVVDRLGLLTYHYQAHFEWLHGIELDYKLLVQAVKLATDWAIAWGSEDVYI